MYKGEWDNISWLAHNEYENGFIGIILNSAVDQAQYECWLLRICNSYNVFFFLVESFDVQFYKKVHFYVSFYFLIIIKVFILLNLPQINYVLPAICSPNRKHKTQEFMHTLGYETCLEF